MLLNDDPVVSCTEGSNAIEPFFIYTYIHIKGRDILIKDWILMDEYLPLEDIPYVFRISKYINKEMSHSNAVIRN